MFSNFFNVPFQRQAGGSSQGPPRDFLITLRAYPGYMCGRDDIEQGNKTLLPSSVLNQLANYRLPSPLMFSIQNTIIGTSTNVGVLEFTAENGTCYLPNWLFEQLNLDIGVEVNLMLLTAVPRGKFVKIQPHETAFIDLPDPRAVLEKQLARYTCLTQGETICVKIADKAFLLNILETKPTNNTNCICVVDADVEVDFAPPLDYKEPEPTLIKRESSLNLDDESDDDQPAVPFQGQGIKLNGQVVKEDPNQKKKKVTNDEYDPRKRRLPNGVRQTIITDDFKNLSAGFKIGMSSVQKKEPISFAGNTGAKIALPLIKKISSGAIAGSTGHYTHTAKDETPTRSVNPSHLKPSINNPNPSSMSSASGIGAGSRPGPALQSSTVKSTTPIPTNPSRTTAPTSYTGTSYTSNPSAGRTSNTSQPTSYTSNSTRPTSYTSSTNPTSGTAKPTYTSSVSGSGMGISGGPSSKPSGTGSGTTGTAGTRPSATNSNSNTRPSGSNPSYTSYTKPGTKK